MGSPLLVVSPGNEVPISHSVTSESCAVACNSSGRFSIKAAATSAAGGANEEVSSHSGRFFLGSAGSALRAWLVGSSSSNPGILPGDASSLNAGEQDQLQPQQQEEPCAASRHGVKSEGCEQELQQQQLLQENRRSEHDAPSSTHQGLWTGQGLSVHAGQSSALPRDSGHIVNIDQLEAQKTADGQGDGKEMERKDRVPMEVSQTTVLRMSSEWRWGRTLQA